MLPVNFQCIFFRIFDGYGHSGLQMMHSLVNQGADIRAREYQAMDRKLEEPWRTSVASILSKPICEAPVVIYYALPPLFREADAYQVGFTQFETDRLPGDWLGDLNRMDEVWTTCPQLVSVFVKSGVMRPIYSVPLGVSSERYPRVRHKKSEPFYFIHTGMPEQRKGFEIAIKAYRLAFGNYDKVRLAIKGTGIPQELNRRQPQGIDFMLGRYPFKLMNDLYARSHCMVYPTSGEGWGMIPLEAMCTGLPTILTSFLGTAEFADYGIPVKHSLVEADYYEHLMPCGDWAKPDLEDLAARMLDVYDNYEEHEERAYENAKVVAEKFTWQESARIIMKHIERIEGGIEGQEELAWLGSPSKSVM